jgi:hypothetical protein
VAYKYSETSIHRFLKKKQWIRENNRCGSHSWNRIRSGTIEIERRIRENELSGTDRYSFHCCYCQFCRQHNNAMVYKMFTSSRT